MDNEKFDIDKDLSNDVFKIFSSRSKIPPDSDMMNTLNNLHLVKNNKMTNAGSWLLAKDITKFNISANISCALFMGNSKTNIIDRKDFSGDIYSMYQDVIEYIFSKLNTAFIITKKGRNEKPEIPEEAIRETVVNAIAHRDYRSTANIQIYIFKNRIEIISPGGLPAGMRIEDLGKKSIPRNPLLFGILYRMNLVEHIGSGITRIITLCEDYNIPVPVIDTSDNWVSVTFTRQTGIDPRPDSQPESRPESLDIRVLTLLKDKPLSKAEISLMLKQKSISGQLNRVVRQLIEEGKIEYTIPDRPNSRLQKYRITGKGKRGL